MNTKLWIGIVIIAFGIGIIAGIPLGMQKGQYMLFEGLNTALEGSNINFTINLNETKLVEEFNKQIVPDMIEKMDFPEPKEGNLSLWFPGENIITSPNYWELVIKKDYERGCYILEGKTTGLYFEVMDEEMNILRECVSEVKGE